MSTRSRFNVTRALGTSCLIFALTLVVQISGARGEFDFDAYVMPMTTLVASDESNGFDLNGYRSAMPEGTIAIEVANASTSVFDHGVALDGGIYEDVEGGIVRPGRRSRLTIDLTPGQYEIYDPADDFRFRGMSTTLTVYPFSAWGTRCGTNASLAARTVALEVRRLKCASAERTAKRFERSWRRGGRQLPIAMRVGTLSCSADTAVLDGEPSPTARVSCRQGRNKLRWTFLNAH